MTVGDTGSPATRRLIVNADDFGQSSGINRGVIASHTGGIVTSASLMVRWPAAIEAASLARKSPSLSVGLHVDLSEWRYHNGDWRAVYQLVSTEDADAVRREVGDQLARFRELTGSDPTHVDSHQHVHRVQPVGKVLGELADRLGVPLRERSSLVRYSGAFYGQTAHGQPMPNSITVGALISLLAELPPGVTEIGCHPADDVGVDSTYRHERLAEMAVLTDERVMSSLRNLGVDLISFRTLAVNPPFDRR